MTYPRALALGVSVAVVLVAALLSWVALGGVQAQETTASSSQPKATPSPPPPRPSPSPPPRPFPSPPPAPPAPPPLMKAGGPEDGPVPRMRNGECLQSSLI